MFELGPILTTAIVAAIGSVGLWKVIEKVLERVWKREDSDREAHKRCLAEVEELKARVAVIEHHHRSYLARWIMDASRRLLWVNDKAFISIFAPLGLSRDALIGKTFADVLEQETAAEIGRLNAAALAHPEVSASNVIQLHRMLPVMVVVMTAAAGREGELEYEGYAYRTNDQMLADGFGAERQRLAVEACAEHMIDGNREGER